MEWCESIADDRLEFEVLVAPESVELPKRGGGVSSGSMHGTRDARWTCGIGKEVPRAEQFPMRSNVRYDNGRSLTHRFDDRQR